MMISIPKRTADALARAHECLDRAAPGAWIPLRVLREESKFGHDMGGDHDLLGHLRELELEGRLEIRGGFNVNQHWRGPCKVRWKMPEVRTGAPACG